jgi:hypothetical protein
MFTILKLGFVLYIAISLDRNSPAEAFIFIIFCFFLVIFQRLFVFAARNFFLGLFAGWGLRESGLLKHFVRKENDRE